MIKRRYWAIMFSLGLAFAVMAPISTSGYRSNSAGASAQAARPLKVVLIGDSYSAGNGARNSRWKSQLLRPRGLLSVQRRMGWPVCPMASDAGPPGDVCECRVQWRRD